MPPPFISMIPALTLTVPVLLNPVPIAVVVADCLLKVPLLLNVPPPPPTLMALSKALESVKVPVLLKSLAVAMADGVVAGRRVAGPGGVAGVHVAPTGQRLGGGAADGQRAAERGALRGRPGDRAAGPRGCALEACEPSPTACCRSAGTRVVCVRRSRTTLASAPTFSVLIWNVPSAAGRDVVQRVSAVPELELRARRRC